MTIDSKSKLSEQELIEVAKASLDRAADELDSDVLKKLQVARRMAVQASAEPRRFTWFDLSNQWVVPTGGVTAAAVVALLLVSFWGDKAIDVDIITPVIEDIQILSSAEDIEMYEDLEFLQWLALEQT